jgi:hypothetical protein
MWTVISYDIDRMHSEVKVAARAAGFQDCVNADGGKARKLLPNTTLFRDTTDVPTAMKEFRKVVASVSSSIRIQKLFGTALGNYWLDSDATC